MAIDKLKEGINLLINNISLFSKIILTVWLPGSILLVFLRYFILPNTTGGDEAAMLLQEIRVSSLVEAALSPLYGGALIYALNKIKQNLPVSYTEAMQYSGERSFKLFATRFSAGFIVFLGLIAFIVPGIVLALRYSLIDEVVVLENTTGGNARKQSAKLTKGKRSKIFVAIFLTWICIIVSTTIISLILSLPYSLLGQAGGFILDVIIECINSVLFGLIYIVPFLFYWDSKRVSDEPNI